MTAAAEVPIEVALAADAVALFPTAPDRDDDAAEVDEYETAIDDDEVDDEAAAPGATDETDDSALRAGAAVSKLRAGAAVLTDPRRARALVALQGALDLVSRRALR